MLIDLHAHTRPISWDSDLTPDELVESAKAAGLDGICLTEHDYFWEPAEARALAKRHNFLVLPAVEVNTENGHILVYGLDKYEYGMHLIEQARGDGDGGGRRHDSGPPLSTLHALASPRREGFPVGAGARGP